MSRLRTILISALLIVSVFPALMMSMASHVYSQAYVTTSTQTVYSNEFVVSGYYSSGGTITCYYQYVQLQPGFAGTTLEGTVTTSTPIHFYVLSSSELNGYVAATSGGRGGAGICDRLKPPSAHLTYYVSTAYPYRMRWTVPDSNDYYFVFANAGTTDATVTFNCWSEQIVTETSQPYTSPVYTPTTTPSTPNVQPTTPTVELQTNPTTFPGLTSIILYVGVFVVIGALVLLYFGRLRGSQKPRQTRSGTKRTQATEPSVEPVSPPSPPQAPERTSGESAMFCSQCGAKMARDSKFCKECGSKQT